MTIWFTSDQHFGHIGAIKHCNRPFSSVEEMNEHLVARYNAAVSPTDTVYMLGDFCWKGANQFIYQLNGTIHYIHGNHDRKRIYPTCRTRLASWQEYKEIDIEGQHIVLFHYPIVDWNRRFHGAWHLFGHVHGNYKPAPGSWDVGVDSNNYLPVSFEQLKTLIVPFKCKTAKEDPAASRWDSEVKDEEKEQE